MTVTYQRTIDSQQVAQTEALDARGVLQDGHTMRTKLTLMDNASASFTVEQRRALIDRYNERVSNAWRDPASSTSSAAELRDEALAKISDPYERYDRRLQDAWR